MLLIIGINNHNSKHFTGNTISITNDINNNNSWNKSINKIEIILKIVVMSSFLLQDISPQIDKSVDYK